MLQSIVLTNKDEFRKIKDLSKDKEIDGTEKYIFHFQLTSANHDILKSLFILIRLSAPEET